jgi:alpha-N-arabinofuranosidase
VEHNDFGMHEFIRFCRILEAEPLITVNTGFGDAYSAAAELEYSNGSTETLMGALRAQNGDLEPFNVRYWCIGNEMWGRWQLGYMSLNHYVQKHNWIVDKMREVDPDIIPIASGNAGEWSEGLLKNCADHIDQIAEHFYCQERPDVVKHTAWIAENIRSKAKFHRKLRKELDTLKGKDIQIAMTEWNYWYGPHLFGELGTRYFHKDGIGIARGLHEFYRQSDIMVMANYAQTVNVIGCIKASKTAAALETTGLVLKLYGNNYGSIPVGSTCDTGSLDVSAALTPDRQALTLSIINPTDKMHHAKLNIRGVELAGTGRLGCIVHSDPQAHNDPDQAPQVVIEEKDLTVVTNAFEVPALSINLYTLPVK